LGVSDIAKTIADLRTPEELYELLDPDVMWYSTDLNSNVTCNCSDDVVACIQRALERGLSGHWQVIAERDDFLVIRPVLDAPSPEAADFHQVFRIRDGLIVEMRDYSTRAAALEYAGLA
jgi:hypothetical protein